VTDEVDNFLMTNLIIIF